MYVSNYKDISWIVCSYSCLSASFFQTQLFQVKHCTAQVRKSRCKCFSGHLCSQTPRLCWFHVSLWNPVISEAECRCSVDYTTLFINVCHFESSFLWYLLCWCSILFFGLLLHLLKMFLNKEICTLKVQIFVVAYSNILVESDKSCLTALQHCINSLQ